MENSSHIEEQGTEFFVTGSSQILLGLNLKYIPHAQGRGIKLSSNGQTLNESRQLANAIFEQAAQVSIKFVLIGLAPYSFDKNAESSLVAENIEEDSPILEEYIELCIQNGAKPVVVTLPVEQSFRKTYNADVVKFFRDTINKFKKKYKCLFIDLLDAKLPAKCFNDNFYLNPNGAAAISSLLSERLYLEKIITVKNIYDMGASYFSILSKYFSGSYRNLMRHTFCDMASADFNHLSETLPKDECLNLMARIFSDMTYDHLAKLSDMLSKDDYNELAARIFKISADKIRRKDKVKVGFVLYDSSTWCGNDLYNLFVNDERFEPTVFLCLRIDKYKGNAVIQKEFLRQTEQLKSNGLNVVALDNEKFAVPEQDLIIYLIPYDSRLPRTFQIKNISVKTLLSYIPYAIDTGKYDATFTPIVRFAWKQFLPSSLTCEMYNKKVDIGTPQRIYSGYPKTDIFFKQDANFQFDWKMTRPDAKKIIWAPHHSVANTSICTATFQWNYQFMYEFAKAHPEISWVVKPHSNLTFNAVVAEIFPSVEDYENYLQAWNDLPNAKVVTGAYYQALFATSNGMIHDCGSFTAEYQYVDKPMIYLIRKGPHHNELGDEILRASYTVDGKDFEGIAAMIQRVFIEGDDYKAAERKEIFDKYLNYPKTNGMLASEFIFKSIADELK